MTDHETVLVGGAGGFIGGHLVADLLRRTHRLDAPQGVRGRSSDNTLIRATYGWEPSTTLREGLERTFGWILDEMKNGRGSR